MGAVAGAHPPLPVALQPPDIGEEEGAGAVDPVQRRLLVGDRGHDREARRQLPDRDLAIGEGRAKVDVAGRKPALAHHRLGGVGGDDQGEIGGERIFEAGAILLDPGLHPAVGTVGDDCGNVCHLRIKGNGMAKSKGSALRPAMRRKLAKLAATTRARTRWEAPAPRGGVSALSTS